MDEVTTYHVILADGTAFDARPDGAGNMVCAEKLDKEIFSNENLSSVTIDGAEYEDQILRTFYYQPDDSTFIRIAEKSEMEKLREDMSDALNGLLDFMLGGE